MHIEMLPRPRTQAALRSSEIAPVRRAAPANINPIEWHQSQGLARQACARIFRDGGNPMDAMQAFGLVAEASIDWGRAVDLIALSISRPGARRSA